MGLDLVELIVAVEESFGLKIPDEDAQRLETPRQLIEYLRGRLPTDGRAGCLSQRAFADLKEAVRRMEVAPNEGLRPDTRLTDLLAARGRSRRWSELGRELGVPLPELGRSFSLLLVGWLASGLAAAWTWGRAGLVAALAVGALELLSFFALTRRWRTRLPFDTVGDLVSFLVLRHSRHFVRPRGSFTPEQIRSVVCGLIARTLGTTEFGLDSDLVRIAESRG